MSLGTFVKDPDAALDYVLDLADPTTPGGPYLATGSADTISGASWAISPSGPTLTPQGFTGTTATVRVSGGTAGALHTITCHFTLSPSGQSDDRSFLVRIQDR